MKRIFLISLICTVSLALASCVDEHDGECNIRDYSDVRRTDMPADPDSGSAGRGGAPERF